MTEEEARRVILTPCYPNIRETLEALEIAKEVLGEDCTMAQIWAWAERGEVEEKD